LFFAHFKAKVLWISNDMKTENNKLYLFFATKEKKTNFFYSDNQQLR